MIRQKFRITQVKKCGYKAFNNSTFKNESDIETALYDWRSNYNNCHRNITRNST